MGIGTTEDAFHALGTVPVLRDRLKRSQDRSLGPLYFLFIAFYVMDIHCTCCVMLLCSVEMHTPVYNYKNEDKVHREIPGRHITRIEIQGCHFIRVRFAMKDLFA